MLPLVEVSLMILSIACRCGEEVRGVVPEGEGEPGVHERARARHSPVANAAGKGLKTEIREVDIPATTTAGAARVFT